MKIMDSINAALLLVTTCLVVVTTANIVPHESRTFMDLFNMFRLNPAARVGVGVQITFPIATFMPDLGMLGRQSRTLSSQKLWPYQSVPSMFSTCPSRGVSIEDYLQLMHIDDAVCQERFVCEMSSDPKKFMPLSEIMLKKLSNNKWLTNSYESDYLNTTEYSLFQAAQFGVEPNQDCMKKYWECPVAATSMVNMDLLWGWQVIANLFNIMFIGETQANVLNV